MSVTLISATDETLCFEVTSSSRPETHDVYFDIQNGWVCTCEHHYYRKAECKHIQACKEFLQENKNYTIVGIAYNNILELKPYVINHIVNMGTYTQIKQWREKECKYQQVMKLTI